jgi:lipid II:glycine glycyltransferase (peptidoglycan interpeptide bridge formation enzyme)
MEVLRYTPALEEELADFVYSHPEGNIFQTPYMWEVYRRARRIEPLGVVAVDRDGSIAGSMLSFISTEKEGLASGFSRRSIIIGGPLAGGERAARRIFEYYERALGQRALFTEVRNLRERRDLGFLTSLDYEYEDHLNFLIDLRGDVWRNIHRTMRKNIRRALRRGVKITEITREEQIDKFYEHLRETYSRAGLPLADVSLFKAAFDVLHPRGMVKFHLAEHEGECIGGRVSLVYRDVVYAWYVGTSRRHAKLYPNALLNWHVMNWAKEEGFSVFDMGGAGKPGENSGRFEFKRQFGGRLVNFGRYRKIHSPLRYAVAVGGFRVLRAMKYW